MNKILPITFVAIAVTIPHSTHAVDLALNCAYVEEVYNCSYKDAAPLDTTTCGRICSTCTGTTKLPTGYVSSNGVTSVRKMPKIGCPERDATTNKYTSKCSCTTEQTVLCDTANGYSGTATFDGTFFSGCTQGGGEIIIGRHCGKGEYLVGMNCVLCPVFNDVSGTTDFMGQNAITDCYIPSGNTFTDDTGTYTLTDNCHYTE